MAPLSKSPSETVHSQGRTPKSGPFSVPIDTGYRNPDIQTASGFQANGGVVRGGKFRGGKRR